MTDDKFEAFLREQAADYNAPKAEVPRDEMWSAIAIVRRRAVMVPARRSPFAAILALAAMLVIGVAIGRYVIRDVAVQKGSMVTARAADSSSVPYAVATANHLSRAEALLTAYNAEKPDAIQDAQMAEWARDLLSNTRLLMDSPAGQNPQRRRLLQDLELVLVQLVQQTLGAGAADERGHIERSIERTQMLPRLRLAQAAGRNSGT